MTFNVLSEPWIPVKTSDGVVKELGILELLEKAPELLEIADAMPHYEYGIYRMLFVFLMDAYRPENEDEIYYDLLDNGSFDMERINEYVKACNADGERFDLLDEKYPFMQCGKDQWAADAKVKSSANLSSVFAAGNNHVHFDHCREKDRKLTFAEAAKAVCSVNLFCTSGVQGYPSTPSGAPPIYSIVKGNTLFETLVYGMVAVHQSRKDDIPLWRSQEYVEPKKQVAKISLLEGLTLPCRRICVLQENGEIASALFEQGLNYVNYTAWNDPYVSYYQTKAGDRANLKPGIDKETWRNLDTLLNISDTSPEIVKQYFRNTNCQNVHVCTYSVVTNQASYLDMQKGEYTIPADIVRTPQRFEVLQEALAATELNGRILRDAVKELAKKLGSDGKTGAAVSECERTLQRYYAAVKTEFFSWLCPGLQKVPGNELNMCRQEWSTKIRRICWDTYDSFAERLGADIHVLMKAQKVKKDILQKEGH